MVKEMERIKSVKIKSVKIKTTALKHVESNKKVLFGYTKYKTRKVPEEIQKKYKNQYKNQKR